MKAIPASRAPAAISPNNSTLLVFELDVVVEAVVSVVLVVAVGVVAVVCWPPLASSLNAFPLAALDVLAVPPALVVAAEVVAASAAGAQAIARNKLATTHKQPKPIRNRAVTLTGM